MRGNTIAAFGFGFGAGMAVLAGALWMSGNLRTSAAAPMPTTTTLTAPAAAPVPAEAPKLPSSASPPPPAAQPFPPVKDGADRTAPDANVDRPIVPVQGVALGQITDTFNDKRDGHKHEALDIPASRGTPVVASVEGNVARLFQSKLGGITVYEFDDSQTYCYYYAHLDHYASGLKEGTLLRQGQVLGYVGTTGNAPKDAPHLHFEVHKLGAEKKWWKGEAVDPLNLLR
jgi:murein DD-endopeptidase MepM/ murein hydrolase activator NlpD